MDNLGSMEPEEILQILTGSFACAFVIFMFIIVYVVMARRGKSAGKRAGLGTTGFRQDTLAGPPMTSTPSASSTGKASLDGEPLPIDVGARLVGTGREAWLTEGPPTAAETPVSDEYGPDHGQEVWRLLRDPSSGQIWVQAAGMRYRSLNDIRDRAVGERVLATITHLLRFSNGMVATDQGVTTLELPACDAVEVPAGFGTLSGAREPGEMIRLITNPGRGHSCVHVVGRCYLRLVDVQDRAIGQHILEAVTRLLQFSNGMLATNEGVGVVPVPHLRADAHTPLPEIPEPSSQVPEMAVSPDTSTAGSDPHLAQSVSPPSGAAAQISEQERFLQELAGQSPAPTQTPIQRPSLVGGLRRMTQQPASDSLAPLNLAEEIDHIFQSKLLASGMAATTDAKVETNPDGGVRIRIGTAYYHSPDEVPDPQLRDMLKQSITEWEQS
jgi:hypothetical protein